MLSKDKVIEAMAKCLNEKEKEILSARWGINNGIPIRIEELKEIYGITIEQLRDIEKRFFYTYRKLNIQGYFQIKDQTVYVDYIVDCRQDYGWLVK